MKKISLLTFLFLTTILYSFAQNPIPNPSFETWHPYASGEQPDFWQTSDSLTMAFSAGHSAVKESADICHLVSSVKLTTVTAFFTNIIPGVATNGLITGPATIVGGSPDTTRHAQLTGCVKYVPSGSNVAMISAYLLKWNSSSGTRDTIATTVYSMSSAITPITNFTSNFVYRDNRKPDSILVILQSSPGINATNAVSGSILTVDNLNVAGIVSGVTENPALKSIHVYPMPIVGDRLLHIDVPSLTYKNASFQIVDETGRIILSGSLKEKQVINTDQLSNGFYLLTLRDDSGEKFYSTKVTIAH